jgi:hypothetical protein
LATGPDTSSFPCHFQESLQCHLKKLDRQTNTDRLGTMERRALPKPSNSVFDVVATPTLPLAVAVARRAFRPSLKNRNWETRAAFQHSGLTNPIYTPRRARITVRIEGIHATAL